VVRRQELKRAVREQQSLFDATVVLIEDKAVSSTKTEQRLGGSTD
jgi:hypothetical protein